MRDSNSQKIIALQATALAIRANFTFSGIKFLLIQEQYSMMLDYCYEVKYKLAERTGLGPAHGCPSLISNQDLYHLGEPLHLAPLEGL